MANYFGRKVIYSALEEITSENVVQALADAIPTHQANARDIDYLYHYYKGKQPILYREKKVRPEINNKIVENHAYEIVDFYSGYVFGEPIQYIKRSEGASSDINNLNSIMETADKPSYDGELAEWMLIGGLGHRMVLPAREVKGITYTPIKLDILDPRDTFVVYSTRFGRPPLMGVKKVTVKNADGQEQDLYCVYTNTHYYEIMYTEGQGLGIVKEEAHSLGGIPIIEYPLNNSRMGAFEPVIPILDAMNKVVSNRVDGIEQFVQAFVKFINCDIDEETFAALKELGAIKVKSVEGQRAEVDVVAEELNQGETQVALDHLYNMMLIIAGMPNRQGQTRSTSDTGQAVLLRDGWGAAESRAKKMELAFKKSERRFLGLVTRILKGTEQASLELKDIDIKFTRNRTDNILTKTQGMQNQLEAGIHPRIAIETCGLYSDPEQVYADSQEYLEKWKNQTPNITPANNKPDNPEEGG